MENAVLPPAIAHDRPTDCEAVFQCFVPIEYGGWSDFLSSEGPRKKIAEGMGSNANIPRALVAPTIPCDAGDGDTTCLRETPRPRGLQIPTAPLPN
jgi:hypothetical protein